jgi:hypothetical protein
MSAQVFFMPLEHEPVYEPVHRDHPAHEPAHKPVYGPVHTPVAPYIYLPFTAKQGTVLLHLIQSGGVGQRMQIAQATGVTLATVKHTLRLAAARGYITGLRTFCQGGLRGFAATLDQVLCGEYLGRFSFSPDRPLDKPVHRPILSSSSLKTKKLTTASIRLKSVNQSAELLIGSTRMFWEGEGLQLKQAKTWCDQFDIEPAQLNQQLEWARHDLVMNNKASEVKKDCVSWFFGVLRKTGGCYPKPQNYKSPAEIRAEQIEQAAREAALARERQRVAEQELAFQEIMSDADGDAYQSLLADVSDFARDMGGKALDIALREAFELRTQQPQDLSVL